MEKHKHEQAFRECKKQKSLIEAVVGKNITVLSRKELDNGRTEYGEIVNASETLNGKYEVDGVWNETDNERSPD